MRAPLRRHVRVGSRVSTHAADTQQSTPCELHGWCWLKRDDLFHDLGAWGTKARTVAHLLRLRGRRGLTLVTAGTRQSSQLLVVARMAQWGGHTARLHVPAGAATAETTAAAALGAQLVRHRPGYTSVLRARAQDDASVHLGSVYLPFGMELRAHITANRGEAEALAREVPYERLVVPVGWGMTLAAVLWGLADADDQRPVLAVHVGSDPTARLDAWGPPGWRDQVELVDCGVRYGRGHSGAPRDFHGVPLDPNHEAHCAQYLRSGDCLWLIGHRDLYLQPLEAAHDSGSS